MRFLLPLLLITTVPLAAADSAFDRGKALLDQHDPAGALVEFKRAAEADPNSAQPLLYCAIASYRAGDLDAAESYGRTALAHAHGAETQQISDVVALIEKRRTRAGHMREGDLAYGDGRFAKAAEAYAAAFAADPDATDAALKAASLYADRLNRLLDAAILWHRVIAHGGPDVEAANTELAQRHRALDQLLTQQMEDSKYWLQDPRRIEKVHLAEAFPDSLELYRHLADAYIGRGESPALTYLKRAVQLGLTFDQYAKLEGVRFRLPLHPHEDLANYAADVFGADAVTALIRECQAEQRVSQVKTANASFAPAWSTVVRTKQWTSPGKNVQTVTVLDRFRTTLTWEKNRYVLESIRVNDVPDGYDRAPAQGVTGHRIELPSFAIVQDIKLEPVPWLNDPRAHSLVLTFSQPVTDTTWKDPTNSGRSTTETHSVTTWEVPVLSDSGLDVWLKQLQQLDLAAVAP